MDGKSYGNFIWYVRVRINKDGIPLYKLAPQIGITDMTLKRFLDGKGVTIFTVLSIAEYYGMDVRLVERKE